MCFLKLSRFAIEDVYSDRPIVLRFAPLVGPARLTQHDVLRKILRHLDIANIHSFTCAKYPRSAVSQPPEKEHTFIELNCCHVIAP